MSLYKQCSEAATKLMEQPPADLGGVFTDIDVVNMAATPNWSKDNWKEALRHANQVLGTLYRGRRLARYGPVILPDGNEDYGRIASKIAYAHAEAGPEAWATPNGRFPRLMIEDDEIGRQGRRFGTNRNDLAPWDTQEIRAHGTEQDPAHTNGNGTIDTGVLERRIRQLEADLNAANKKLREIEHENERLREHHAGPVEVVGDEAKIKKIAEDAALAVVGDLDERVQNLERVEKKRQELYAA